MESVLLTVIPSWMLHSASYRARELYIQTFGQGELEVPDRFDEASVEGDWILKECNGCLTLWEATMVDEEIRGLLLLIPEMSKETANGLLKLNGNNTRL